MASAPILSVLSALMPVYNAEHYVAEAVESILAQTFRDLEFLIIDDGSTDSSGAILRRYAERNPRTRVDPVVDRAGHPGCRNAKRSL